MQIHSLHFSDLLLKVDFFKFHSDVSSQKPTLISEQQGGENESLRLSEQIQISLRLLFWKILPLFHARGLLYSINVLQFFLQHA